MSPGILDRLHRTNHTYLRNQDIRNQHIIHITCTAQINFKMPRPCPVGQLRFSQSCIHQGCWHQDRLIVTSKGNTKANEQTHILSIEARRFLGARSNSFKTALFRECVPMDIWTQQHSHHMAAKKARNTRASEQCNLLLFSPVTSSHIHVGSHSVWGVTQTS